MLAIGNKQQVVKTMELVVEPGCAPRFPFEQFRVCEKQYKWQEEKVCWKDIAALRNYCRTVDGPMARIVGTIDAETSEKWFDWDNGELFAVSFAGVLCFCLPGGTIVVGK